MYPILMYDLCDRKIIDKVNHLKVIKKSAL